MLLALLNVAVMPTGSAPTPMLSRSPAFRLVSVIVAPCIVALSGSVMRTSVSPIATAAPFSVKVAT